MSRPPITQVIHRILIVFVISGAIVPLHAQSIVRFIPRWQGLPVFQDSIITSAGPLSSARISTLRFYISNPVRMNQEKVGSSDGKEAHLIDAFDMTRNTISIDSPAGSPATDLCFTLGLDSTVNTSGILEGDLDPVEGMYWTWQSGFIHFKLEGEISLNETGVQRFEYHLGGYRTPYATSKEVCLHSDSPRQNWTIALALDRFLDSALVLEKPRLMSPGPDAVRLIERAASLFELIDQP